MMIALGIYFILGVIAVGYIEPVLRKKGYLPVGFWRLLGYVAVWPLYLLAFLLEENY